jgi:dipeptidyl aminopeptidase/acylaminoacyl peptidase
MAGINDVDVPVLIFHGTEDFLPVPPINEIHDNLAGRDVEVQFLRMANEGHGYNAPASQKYAGQLQIDFFRRHLIDAEVDPWPPPGTTIYLPAAYRGVGP